jgi:chemotaxis receptor (MCP) glutamine deamidase CheD
MDGERQSRVGESSVAVAEERRRQVRLCIRAQARGGAHGRQLSRAREASDRVAG